MSFLENRVRQSLEYRMLFKECLWVGIGIYAKRKQLWMGEKSSYDADLVTAMANFPGYLGARIALQSCLDLSQDR